MMTQDYWPPTHEPWTDRYFRRSKQVLEAENINPHVMYKNFCRESFELTIETVREILDLIDAMPTQDTTFHVRQPGYYQAGEPLVLYEGPAQELIDLETVFLGVLSFILQKNHGEGGPLPWPEEFRANVQKAAKHYESIDVPMLYFGARHYPWWKDKALASIALSAGCVQTSTDIGSYNIYKRGVGTTPHALTILMAWRHGAEQATLATAMAFDDHIEKDVPRTILCDTFNREATDTLLVLKELVDERGLDPSQCGVRIDTCGENVAETGKQHMQGVDDPYLTGEGVTISAVRNLRLEMMKAGFGEAQLFVSSGMGNPEKAKRFVKAAKQFEEQHDAQLFHGVGAGDFAGTIQCTSDICRIEGEPFNKAGREVPDHELERCEFFTLNAPEEKGLPNIELMK